MGLEGIMFKKAILSSVTLIFFIGSGTARTEDDSLRNRIKIKKKSNLSFSKGEETEEMSIEKRELLSQKRRGLIQDIKAFLREARSADQKAELNLRLGQLFMEDYYSGLAKAQAKYDAELLQQQKSN